MRHIVLNSFFETNDIEIQNYQSRFKITKTFNSKNSFKDIQQ